MLIECQASVNRGVSGVMIKYQLSVDRRYQSPGINLGVDQHLTRDAFSTYMIQIILGTSITRFTILRYIGIL